MSWPIYYPDRPDIPYDPTPPTKDNNWKRSQRRLAEAGHRPGRPVKKIKHFGLADAKDRPVDSPEG